MYTVWTNHLKDPQEQEEFKKSLQHSKWILEHLKMILGKRESSIERAEISPRAYDNPNWQFKQADSNGYRRCLKEIQDLIDLDQQEHK